MFGISTDYRAGGGLPAYQQTFRPFQTTLHLLKVLKMIGRTQTGLILPVPFQSRRRFPPRCLELSLFRERVTDTTHHSEALGIPGGPWPAPRYNL